jgi:hypothetical protein
MGTNREQFLATLAAGLLHVEGKLFVVAELGSI